MLLFISVAASSDQLGKEEKSGVSQNKAVPSMLQTQAAVCAEERDVAFSQSMDMLHGQLLSSLMKLKSLQDDCKRSFNPEPAVASRAP